MSKASTEKNIPDSHITYESQRVINVRGYAETKFGNSLIHVKVNRQDKRFDIIVKDNVKDADKKDFEERWTMCKVLKVIS